MGFRPAVIDCDGEEFGGLGVSARTRRGVARVVSGAPDSLDVVGAERMVGP